MSDNQIKININFPISGPVLAKCLEINKEVANLAGSVVRFGSGGNSTPHVTLMMGTVKTANIPELERLARGYAQNLPAAIPVAFSRPYREDLTGRYVMADVSVPDQVLSWRTELQDAVKGYFVDAARMSQDLHVTLAVLDKPSPMADSYLTNSALLPSSNFSDIEISEAGPKGAKLNVLAKVKFGNV